MRVLALLTDGIGGFGGIARYNIDLLEALLAVPNVRQIDAVARWGSAVEGERLRHLAPRPQRWHWVLTAIRLAWRRPQLIFVGHLNFLWLARVLAWLTGARLWVQTHGIEAWPPALSRRRARALLAADLITAVSRHTRDQLLKASPVDPRRIVVLPDTVDQGFAPEPDDRQATRVRLGIAASTRVLLTVGRLDARERYKGQDRVIAALPALRRTHPDTLYLIVGDGDDRARLEALAVRAEVAAHVRFLGRVAHEDLAALYRAADLFVMPSEGEGFGIVFLEAMACGTRALGLGVDASRDPLADGALGIVSTHAGLADDLARALDQPVARQALAAAVVARFGYPRFAQQLRGLIEQRLA